MAFSKCNQKCWHYIVSLDNGGGGAAAAFAAMHG